MSLPRASTPRRGRPALALLLAAVSLPAQGQTPAPAASASAASAEAGGGPAAGAGASGTAGAGGAAGAGSGSTAAGVPQAGDERLARVRERKAALERDLARLRGQEKSLLGEVEGLELEVRLRTEQLRESQLVLQRAQRDLETTVVRARDLESAIGRARPQLAQRARDLYKLGELSYLRMLLSVDRPQDFLLGYRFVTALARRDRIRMASFRGDLDALERTRADLVRQTTEAQALRVNLDRARRSLDADRRRKTELLTRLVERKELQATYLQELEEAEGRLSGLISGLAEGDASVPMSAFRGELPWPAAGRVRTSFGRHKHPRFDTYTVMNGIEIDAPVDAPVLAVHEGQVAYADLFRGYGMLVVVDHGGKHHTLYAHLGEIKVQVGQKVTAGHPVGTVGSSSLEGAGLYFEVRFQGKPQDPAEWLKDAGAAGR